MSIKILNTTAFRQDNLEKFLAGYAVRTLVGFFNGRERIDGVTRSGLPFDDGAGRV